MEENLDHLRARLEDYLRQKGVNSARLFHCLNPVHKDCRPSMGFHRANQQVHCFSCGATYDLFDLIGVDYCLESFSDQLEMARTLFSSSSHSDSCDHSPESCENPPCRSPISGISGVFLQAIRGIRPDTLARFDAYIQDSRLYFPIVEDNQSAGWCARALDDREPRYCNSRGKLGIWNGDRLLDAQVTEIFVTEGVFDGLTLEQLGYPAISLCGSQNTRKLLDRCAALPELADRVQFVLCGDADAAGEKMNKTLKRGLKQLGISCRILSIAHGKDINEWVCSGAALEGLEDDCTYPVGSLGESLDAFFQMVQRDPIPTGFAQLDQVLEGGLSSGLCVMGGISSVGKTSFVLQIADYVAESGRDVLFFSLEQGRFEILAKSLSRLSAERSGGASGFTAAELLRGNGAISEQQLFLEETRARYRRIGAQVFLRDDVYSVEEIRAAVEEHLQTRGGRPLVIVDYLQILQATDVRATDKQNTDRAVVELKRISRDNNLPVIAVSSFNREAYRSVASMESFKESGAVEYSSDLLIGIQLVGAGDAGFDVNKAKLSEPRALELVVLKNRCGVSYARVPLCYWARYNLFLPGGKRRG